MLREAGVETEAGAAPVFETFETSTGSGAGFRSRQEVRAHWQSVDRALRTIASRRTALDAEEARWLREAEKCQIWRPLGMVSALDYMERVLGYAPRSALERLRVARAPTGRAKFQIALTVCARCRQGWQDGAGAEIAISPAAVERATCDAQHVGSLDGPGPERAYQDVPPSVVRFVWRRDDGRCRIPGCRSSRGLEIHHLTHRFDGGRHDPSNLIYRRWRPGAFRRRPRA